jgi:glycosyltransferase involved in cell wall biosynthesis
MGIDLLDFSVQAWWVLLLFGLFAGSVVLSLFYQLYFFRRLAFYRQSEPSVGASAMQELPGVSVVVCAWNELENLKKLLPVLLEQNYPKFEVVVVDDRSDEECYEYLLFESLKEPRLQRVRIDDTPDHVSSKKYALTLGIKAAQYDCLLLTDADCLPQSKDWIALMTSGLRNDKQVVLGFSPYRYSGGWLNFLIRHETFYTAVQYMSFAVAGIPYMGVGRNLSYRKSLFLQNKGFRSHLRVVGGDDDLFVSEVARRNNTAVCLDPDAFTISEPKRTFGAWLRQKRRHLAVGKKYRFGTKVLLGGLLLSQGLFWACGILLLALWAFVPFVAAGFLLRIVLQAWFMQRTARRLDASVSWYTLLVFEVLYLFYYLFVGTWALLTKRASWI